MSEQPDLFGGEPAPIPKPEPPPIRKPIVVREHTRVPSGMAERKPRVRRVALEPEAPKPPPLGKDAVMQIAADNVEKFSKEFMAFLPDNIHVYAAFEREALRVVARGFKHYSARTIIHVLRHHSALEENGSAWKLNNNTSPYLARLFDLLHPEHVGLWEYRETKRVRQDRGIE